MAGNRAESYAESGQDAREKEGSMHGAVPPLGSRGGAAGLLPALIDPSLLAGQNITARSCAGTTLQEIHALNRGLRRSKAVKSSALTLPKQF